MSEIKFFELAYLNLLNFACVNSGDCSRLLIFAKSNVYFFSRVFIFLNLLFQVPYSF